MTDAQRQTAILQLIKDHATANSVSRSAARNCLIHEGIYTAGGKLAVEFGGNEPNVKPKKIKTSS